MPSLLEALWPLFALILLGFLFMRCGLPGDAFWPGADRLNYFVLFPALLFANLAKAPLTDPSLARIAGAVFLGLGLGWGALLILRRLRDWPAARFGVLTQGTLRFNTYLGLAIIGSLFGETGLELAALMLGLMVPSVNLMSVWALTAERGLGARALLLPMAKNPLILACLAGAVWNLAGLPLSGGAEHLLGLLATASLPLGLLCVGAALNPAELRGETAALTWNAAVRLLGMPLLAWGSALLLGLGAMETTILAIFFSLPCAPTAYALARQLGGDGHLMAGIITLQTLLAALSLPLVVGLLGS